LKRYISGFINLYLI